VPGGERRPELPGRHEEREVPRDDLTDDADRLAERVGVELGPWRVRDGDVDRVPLDLRRPAGHVVEEIGGQRNVGHLRYRERLAVVEGLQLGELVQVLQDEVSDPPHDPSSRRRRHASPRAVVESASGRLHGAIDVLGAPGGNGRKGVARRGVRRRERRTRCRVDPLATDEELVARLCELLDLASQCRCAHADPLLRRDRRRGGMVVSQ
jgi:ParB family chromosome partitioning protein